jgi:hypothetical protein
VRPTVTVEEVSVPKKYKRKPSGKRGIVVDLVSVLHQDTGAVHTPDDLMTTLHRDVVPLTQVIGPAMTHLRAEADPTAPHQAIDPVPVVVQFRAIGPVLAPDRANLVIVPRPAVGPATI